MSQAGSGLLLRAQRRLTEGHDAKGEFGHAASWPFHLHPYQGEPGGRISACMHAPEWCCPYADGGPQLGSEDDSGDEEANVRRSMDSSPPINRNELTAYSATSSVGGPLAGGLTIPEKAQNPDDPGRGPLQRAACLAADTPALMGSGRGLTKAQQAHDN